MQKSLRLSKSLGEVGTESGIFELVATRGVIYDKQTDSVVVMLNSFLQLRKAKRPGVPLFVDSMAGRGTIIKRVAKEKGEEAADLIFANWVHRVQQTKLPRVQSVMTPEAATIAFISPPANQTLVTLHTIGGKS
jgi:hypothetical protein